MWSAKQRSNRGSVLVEVSVALGIAALLAFGLMQTQRNMLTVREGGEISAALTEVLRSESGRIRSLPLVDFYTDSSLTETRTSPLVYYRAMPLWSARESGTSTSTRYFARIEIKLQSLSGAAGSLVVSISARPVYASEQPSTTVEEGIARNGTFVDRTPQGRDLSKLTEVTSFVAL